MIIINKATLIEAFNRASEEGYPYVFVVIEAEGIEECIVVPRESFEAKKEFYIKAYSDDLVHVMNSKVKITNVGYGAMSHLINFI